MKFFKKLFGIKKKEEKEVEVIEEVVEPGIEKVQVNNKIIKVKCQYCRHKKARRKGDGTIVCRRCKSIIGRAV